MIYKMYQKRVNHVYYHATFFFVRVLLRVCFSALVATIIITCQLTNMSVLFGYRIQNSYVQIRRMPTIKVYLQMIETR